MGIFYHNTMKFKSRRNTLFTLLGTALITFLGGAATLACLEIPENLPSDEVFESFFPIAIVVIAGGVLTSMFFFTHYNLDNKYLKYRCGVIYGKVEIRRIREIIVGKTMWVGLKPATATTGLIVKYDKYEELYISPDSNNSFVEAILKIKPDIVITEAT